EIHERQRGKEPGLRPACIPFLGLVLHLDDFGTVLRPAFPSVSLARLDVVADVDFHHALALARCAFRASSRARCWSVWILVIRGLMKFCVIDPPAPPILWLGVTSTGLLPVSM